MNTIDPLPPNNNAPAHAAPTTAYDASQAQDPRIATPRFTRVARLLHWLMAALILAMLFIGAGMVATVAPLHDRLFAWHKPLGIAVLALAALRLLWRLRHPPPPLPADLAPVQALTARASHVLLYALMFAVPLLGWATLSSAGLPVSLPAGVVLPPIAPADPAWFAWLRPLHRALAYTLFATVLLHLAAALHHGLVRRDGVLAAMLGWERARPVARAHEAPPAG